MPPAPLVRIRVDPPEVFRTTVCTRPFREAGPRIETETVGRKTVVHNYGHGGSGWSLSWGSAAEAVSLAMASSPRQIAVVRRRRARPDRCHHGAAGPAPTSPSTPANAFRSCARPAPPAVGRLISRIAKAAAVTDGFPAFWERMARTAPQHAPVLCQRAPAIRSSGWTTTSCTILRNRRTRMPPPEEDPGFLYLQDRIPRPVAALQRRTQRHASFRPPKTCAWDPQMTFNVADYSHQLESDFFAAGGHIEHADFSSPADFAHLKEHVIICCTGYGSRALWKDDSIIPVRGQIVWLVPQERRALRRVARFVAGAGAARRHRRSGNRPQRKLRHGHRRRNRRRRCQASRA
ncbi:MAG: D-amino-acid oxidase [Asticcacaulis sp.]